MKLFLIRHTKVEIETGVCCGQSDIGVASTFQYEKERIWAEIKDVDFDAVYSSPLFRCKMLAENCFEKDKIIFDDHLKELNFGDWELQKWDDIYASPKGKIWMDNYQALSTLNGESYPEMVKRISGFYAELKNKNYKQVAIFTHAGVIRIFKSIIENIPIDELFSSFKPDYASITEFETDE